jgi:hypothetical protein
VAEESKVSGGPLQVNPPAEKTWFSRCCPCLTIEFFQSYFDVTTLEIQNRLLASLIPFNKKFHTLYRRLGTLLIRISLSGSRAA